MTAGSVALAYHLPDKQKYAAELGYAPLPQNIVSRSLAALGR